jgi:hypothetical protein
VNFTNVVFLCNLTAVMARGVGDDEDVKEYATQHYLAASACIAGRNVEGYRAYASLVSEMVRAGAEARRDRVPGAPSITLRSLFLDALDALSSCVTHEVLDLTAVPEVLSALRASAAAAGPRGDHEVAVMARFALGFYAVTIRERGAASEEYGAAIAAGGAAAAAGLRLGHDAAGALQSARRNLAVIAAPPVSVEKFVANAAVLAAAPSPADRLTHSDGPLPAATPRLCSHGGASAAEMRCARCRVARYCNAACQRERRVRTARDAAHAGARADGRVNVQARTGRHTGPRVSRRTCHGDARPPRRPLPPPRTHRGEPHVSDCGWWRDAPRSCRCFGYSARTAAARNYCRRRYPALETRSTPLVVCLYVCMFVLSG